MRSRLSPSALASRRHPLASLERAAGVVWVVVLHGLVLYALWANGGLSVAEKPSTVFVTLIPSADPRPASTQSTPLSVRTPLQPPGQAPASLAISPPHIAVVTAPADAAATNAVPAAEPMRANLSSLPSLTSATATAAPTAQVVPSAGIAPLALTAELSVICSERPAPAYPPLSLRLRESGAVVVRVELDEMGHVASAKLDSASGFARLDAAALSAVRGWRCAPTQRNGQAVRATALQPFNFQIQ